MINDTYTFENFSVTEKNSSAFNAVKTFAKSFKTNNLPLYLSGNHGQGKTHLLHAIANANKNNNIFYITADNFVQEFLESLRNHTVRAFKAKYRMLDLLLLDDIQDLAGKEGTQQEISFILKDLLANKKNVVFASSKPIFLLEHFSENLISIFKRSTIIEIPSESEKAAYSKEHKRLLSMLKDKCDFDWEKEPLAQQLLQSFNSPNDNEKLFLVLKIIEKTLSTKVK